MVGHMIGADGRVMRNMPFVILFNLAWLFLYPLLARLSFVQVILPTLISVPVFVYLHLCTYFYGGPADDAPAVHRRATSCWASRWRHFNLAGLGYLIFGFFSLAFSLPTRIAWKVIFGVVAAVHPRDHAAGSQHGRPCSAAPCRRCCSASRRSTPRTPRISRRHLRRSNEEIMRLATLAERERIGRDLHDLLGHTLSVVALKSELARKLIDRDLDAARSEIGEVERVARDALSQVRNAVSGIRSTALSAELVAATALLEAQGLKVKCETENVKLPHDRETALAL